MSKTIVETEELTRLVRAANEMFALYGGEFIRSVAEDAREALRPFRARLPEDKQQEAPAGDIPPVEAPVTQHNHTTAEAEAQVKRRCRTCFYEREPNHNPERCLDCCGPDYPHWEQAIVVRVKDIEDVLTCNRMTQCRCGQEWAYTEEITDWLEDLVE